MNNQKTMERYKQNKFCGLCNQSLEDGKHKIIEVEITEPSITGSKLFIGAKVKNVECPYYVGFIDRPVILIPRNKEEEVILKILKEGLHEREDYLREWIKKQNETKNTLYSE